MAKLTATMFNIFWVSSKVNQIYQMKLFSQAVSQTSVPRPKKCYPDLTCLSKQKIPFVLPPELSAVLSMPPVERFRTGSNNVAQLVPDASVPCSECFKMSWSEPYLSCTSLIVTERRLLQAHGMQKMIIIYIRDVHVTLLYIVLSQKCTTVQCTGCLHYDGRGQCLLHMKHMIFSYEVLRQFMFRFLIGGYVKWFVYRF